MPCSVSFPLEVPFFCHPYWSGSMYTDFLAIFPALRRESTVSVTAPTFSA